MLSAFADISLAQFALIAGVSLVASVLGGVAGYGTGALMPLILVPIVGPEPVVPIVAISALFTNSWRTLAFYRAVDFKRAAIVAVCATPTTILTAYGYTFLTGKGAMLVIGAMLMLTVPLRYMLKRRAVRLSDKGLAAGAVGYGVAVGGTVGAGVILLSILMAAGLQGAAVIATDAVVSIAIGLVRLITFGVAGAVDGKVLAFAMLIGAMTLPGSILAKFFVERMPIHVHSAILDAVVVIGGLVMVVNAFNR